MGWTHGCLFSSKDLTFCLKYGIILTMGVGLDGFAFWGTRVQIGAGATRFRQELTVLHTFFFGAEFGIDVVSEVSVARTGWWTGQYKSLPKN